MFLGSCFSAVVNLHVMKRRRFIQAIASMSAAPAVLVQQVSGRTLTQQQTAASQNQTVEPVVLDAVGETVPGFFSPDQFAALRHLCEMLMPEINGKPGALDAGVPEFLDFLIGDSPPDRQELYRTGLDRLNAESQQRFSKRFADLRATQATALLTPLQQAWTQEPAANPLGRFLAVAKEDVRRATVNSLEWNTAQNEAGGRRRSGVGMYWYTIE